MQAAHQIVPQAVIPMAVAAVAVAIAAGRQTETETGPDTAAGARSVSESGTLNEAGIGIWNDTAIGREPLGVMVQTYHCRLHLARHALSHCRSRHRCTLAPQLPVAPLAGSWDPWA